MKKQIVHNGQIWKATISLDQGEVIVSHRHKFDHTTHIRAGTVVIAIEGVKTVYEAPASVIIVAGINHRIEALTPAVVQCVHSLAPGEVIEDAILDSTADLLLEHGSFVVPPQRAF